MTPAGNAGGGPSKKRHRVGSNSRLSSTAAVVIDSSSPDGTLSEASHKLPAVRRTTSHSLLPSSSSASSCGGEFNDPTSADVIVRLFIELPSLIDFDESESISAIDSVDQPDVQVYLHSRVLRRSKYFTALLSDRWQTDSDDSHKLHRFNLGVSATDGSLDNHLNVLRLLYVNDFSTVIVTASAALEILPVALELLFEDCVKFCVRFLEVVPWSEEEEKRVLSLIPLLSDEESEELLARVSPGKDASSEEMLHGLIVAAIHNHPNMAFAKAFVAKLLRDFSSRESAKEVLNRAFGSSLKIVQESLEAYSSPDFRGDHYETEAIQRLNLHTAMTNGKHLLWLVERMIELRVADTAINEWSNQAAFTADLQRAFRDDAWRNIAPSLPAVLLRCTSKLSNAVANGTILASRQVRMKLVKDWLPVLIVCKDVSSSHKSLYMELEEAFLKIISTLPMSESQELLQQCLSFSTRNVEDCPHLVTAFNTWFRRASRPSLAENLLG